MVACAFSITKSTLSPMWKIYTLFSQANANDHLQHPDLARSSPKVEMHLRLIT